MFEIHFHCLPGIDDGPRDWEQSLELCRAAAADGVETIVATPHVHREPWNNNDPRVIDRLVLELNTRLGGFPKIVPGCEVLFSADLVELWEKGAHGPLIGLNRGPYLLVEFPATSIHPQGEAVIHELTLLGITPVIAHPERNLALVREPERLERLTALGAAVQITAASLLGNLGRTCEMVAGDFIDRGLVRFVASDAHSIDRRPPRLSAARQRVREIWGEDVETQLFDLHPRLLIESSFQPGGELPLSAASPQG
jgi:protein-tyrosine phosphatase